MIRTTKRLISGVPRTEYGRFFSISIISALRRGAHKFRKQLFHLLKSVCIITVITFRVLQNKIGMDNMILKHRLNFLDHSHMFSEASYAALFSKMSGISD